jgi:putative oxidoreductase
MDIGLLVLRFAVGLTLAAHGAQKLFGWFGGYGLDGTGKWMEGIGFFPGRRFAFRAGLTELVGGLLVAVGFLTPLGAALVASVMLVAAITVTLQKGFFAANGGYELNFVLGIAAVSVAFTGPGALSIDRLLGYQFGGLVWGIGAVVVAVLGSVAQLAQRHPLPTAAASRTAA